MYCATDHSVMSSVMGPMFPGSPGRLWKIGNGGEAMLRT